MTNRDNPYTKIHSGNTTTSIQLDTLSLHLKETWLSHVATAVIVAAEVLVAVAVLVECISQHKADVGAEEVAMGVVCLLMQSFSETTTGAHCHRLPFLLLELRKGVYLGLLVLMHLVGESVGVPAPFRH